MNGNKIPDKPPDEKDEALGSDERPSSSHAKDAVEEKVELSTALNSSDDEDDESKDDASAFETLTKFMAEKLLFNEEDELVTKVLDEVSLKGIVKYIKSGKCKNIVVMAGAGISTSAGIPDFRSPKSGLYDNLSKYNLPYPQAIFEIDFFKKNPKPFFELAKELIPGTYKPTVTHYFIRFLHEKGLLLRHFTQNIDGLEKLAGIPAEKIVEAHGTFYTSHCMDCKKEFSLDWMKERIFSDEIPHCNECQALVKPDIVFFGEDLPERFFALMKDFPKADLLIIMGSSLAVQPFASLVSRVSQSCPRLLLNKEKAGMRENFFPLFGMGGGLNLDSDKNYRDVAVLGTCDELVTDFLQLLGWSEEFEEMMKSLS